ncbi:MAG: bifunctional helix-turn-helix transcriptional regulator/GNAT family N-acetyltransferase, partial [Myxococcales bacterium]|nr:bifunctional helix-turn-helix transcriptional regulator/GNAT family N-acetyltransferase [Myxococcales bacterium]
VVGLAEQLLLDKSSLSRALADLERRGLVESTPHPTDGRSRKLSVTAAGRDVLAQVHESANRQVLDALRILTPSERAEVERGLGLYANALHRARRRAEFSIRPLEPADDPAVANLVRSVMASYGCRGEGFAYGDPEVSAMFAQYSQPRHSYLVVTRGGEVRGGGGIGPLVGADPSICELRKMYFYEDARGLGLGTLVLQRLLDEAQRLGFRQCYLETLDTMGHANKLYRRFGFQRIEAPLGATGHVGCNTFYSKSLG